VLDETMRERLRTLALSEVRQLDLHARERIVKSVVSSGPAVVRRARMERIARGAGAFTLAAAAGAVILLRFAGDGATGDAGRHAAAPPPSPATLQSPPRSCETRAFTPSAFARGPNASVLDMGKALFVTATPDSNVKLQDSNACQTVIQLDSGRVTLQARDLGGGEIRVRVRGSEIVTKDGLVAVGLVGADLAVEVADGSAMVSRPGSAARVVERGTKVTFSTDIVAESALGPERSSELRQAVSAASR
jgi:hypothetical protein